MRRESTGTGVTSLTGTATTVSVSVLMQGAVLVHATLSITLAVLLAAEPATPVTLAVTR